MDGIDWASSAMVAARTRLDIATGNLANVSSGGFRAVVARGRLTAHGAEITRVASSEHGSLVHTGRPSDLAIVGDGSFRVRDGGGNVTDTRNGAFTRDRSGVLRDDAGRALVATRLAPGASVRTGYLETANVNAIAEMVDVLGAQRSFESAEKVVAAIDGVNQKAGNDVARIK
jgi:flagellar basal body rod protein FlgG